GRHDRVGGASPRDRYLADEWPFALPTATTVEFHVPVDRSRHVLRSSARARARDENQRSQIGTAKTKTHRARLPALEPYCERRAVAMACCYACSQTGVPLGGRAAST